ncbi:MAG: hypothetical protein COY66_05780 [Candidatus Kerfeldbacteria bacterium CG_4_10_14_0_8_um_filter_42_10]|uniref:Mannosyl-glycoprotein endo-beta-N-acetylglucosamidase-like domain-containing protein n=1 Tax=Candidatus Kerfeldbacteria bacterium CG_4_10_14_0_8_um_filter_42_10 TaxID=2014248 RepID=A0A2M7RGD0_9BACT|nr:MAG: hypothetical protein COY66_05780 [Candidatus Kerfeldbacteria bacterium CG_4_10_14_0_8_um_filter_42_10]
MKKVENLLPNKCTSKISIYFLMVFTLSLLLGLVGYAQEIYQQEPLLMPEAKAQEMDQKICGLDEVICPEETSAEIIEAEEMLKGSPMQGLGKAIVETANTQGVSWKLIIGLAYAESSLGRSYWFPYDKENCHNYWGIKPPAGRRADGSYLRCYYTDQDGINSIVGLLSRRYRDQRPEQMCGVYKKPCEQHWINNVNKYYKQG